ncbi:MAG: aminopeptidase P family protein [Chloroflexaceae bacterium]|nr:aminopeptidase P family protein [Chloroflexaceae bacterium]
MPTSLATTLQQRRQRLASLLESPALLWSGQAPARNFPANPYPFRASSHFLYFAGLSLENAVIRLHRGQLTLFMDDPDPASILWHGAPPTRTAIAEQMGADRACPLGELTHQAEGAATLPIQDRQTCEQQSRLLQRPLTPTHPLAEPDLALARAIIHLRLTHDAPALAEIQQAITVAIAAHRAGMAATSQATTEAEVRGAMESVILSHNLSCAYRSIVTVRGEVLHNEDYSQPLQPGDLLLADVGAESQGGWASDITRTWPVSGRFSPTQRQIYELVLAAHDACIARLRPGVEYREIHLLAAEIIATGLVELGILRGHPQTLVERDAHALFFPHGIGHLLGLDVHDLEDLGDLAGYAEGRTRSQRFGLGYLRLDRPLQAGMAVTIEPGFYQVPAILNHPHWREQYRSEVNWERLAAFADVRGIRIEDDVLITDKGAQVLSAALPTAIADIETLCTSEIKKH